MGREIPRTLQSLARGYQLEADRLEYEVLLVDNGSPIPLDIGSWRKVNAPVRLLRIDEASSSPAAAINQALDAAQGEVVCLMIDGAHLLTPGVFKLALACFSAFAKPVVAARYFYLGPEEQPISITRGYDKATEDRLLQAIHWPAEGYRLFEIATPLRSGAKNITWLNRMFESNCLFLSRSLLREIGGAETRFDAPGGGFLNLDIFKRAIDAPGVMPVQLIGEGSFHQLHGGTTTNASQADRRSRLASYRKQYRNIRGHDELLSDKELFFIGHLPTEASKIHRHNS